MKKSSSLAATLGSILAVVQSFFDDLFGLLFRKLKSPEVSKTKKSDAPWLRFLKTVAHFFGELGESFYSTYERIKKDKKK